MPSFITDKASIDELFIGDKTSENHIDLNHFIKYDFFGYKLVCDFSDVEEYKKASEENPIWELLMDKFGSIEFANQLNKRIHEEKFYKILDEQNIFLLKLSKKECKELTDENGYIYLSPDDLTDWDKFRICRNNLKFKVTHDTVIPEDVRLNKWTKLGKFSSPLNSLVLFDKYIFSDSSTQKLSDNLFKLISVFCKDKKIKKQLTLTIISEFETDKAFLDSFKKLSNHLKAESINKVSLNLIRHSKSHYPSNFNGLHYRVILTNFFHFKCDDSFNFFKPNGKINNDADLNISFCLSGSNSNFFRKELNDLKLYVSKLTNLPSTNILPDKLTFHPDKNNHLFNH